MSYMNELCMYIYIYIYIYFIGFRKYDGLLSLPALADIFWN